MVLVDPKGRDVVDKDVQMMRSELVRVGLMKWSEDKVGVVLCGGRKDEKASAKLEIRART